MRILQQELYKTFWRRSIFVVLVFLLFLNLCLINVPSSASGIHPISSKKAFQIVLRKNENERLDFVQSHLDQLYQNPGDTPLLAGRHFLEELQLFRRIEKQLQQIEQYPEYLSGIIDNNKSGISIFVDISDYSKKEKEATRLSFLPLQGIRPQFVNSDFLLQATETASVDALNLVFIAYVAISLIFYEKKQGLFALFSTMRNGRGALIRSKILTMMIVVLISTFLFWGSAFLSCWMIHQPFDLSAPLQSVLGYDRSVLNVSIGQYLLLFLAAKILICFVIALLMLFLALVSKQTTSLYTSICLLFVFSYALRRMIPGDSALNILHYVNLLPFIAVYPVLKVHFHLNILGTPIAIKTVFFAAVLLSIVLLIIASSILFRKGKFQVPADPARPFQFRNSKVHSHLLLHEAYKLFIVQRGIWIILLLGAVQILLATTIKPPVQEEFYYQNYMKQLSGEWDKEKEKFLHQEAERFADLERLTLEAEERYGNHEISEQELLAIRQYVSGNRVSYSAFLRLQDRVNAMKQMPAADQVLVYETGYEILTGKSPAGTGNELIQTALFLACLIILLTTYMAEEYETGMVKMINTMYNGNICSLRIKLALGFLAMLMMYMVSYIPALVMIHRYYPLKHLHTSLSLFPSITDSLSNLPVGGYLAMVYFIRLIAASATLLLCYWFAGRIKKSHVAISILIALAVFPLLLRLLGIEWIDYLSLNSFYSGGRLFGLVKGYKALLLLLIPLALIVSTYQSLRRSWQ